MKFSSSVDMALRILVYLAEREGEGLASAPEVSQALQVSYNNVVRIINRLQNTGVIMTHAGRYGGMELGLPVEQITVRAVATAIDGPTKLSPCSNQFKGAPPHKKLTPYHSCEEGNCGNCSIRNELISLNSQIDALLESVTIASIAERHMSWQKKQSDVEQTEFLAGEETGVDNFGKPATVKKAECKRMVD